MSSNKFTDEIKRKEELLIKQNEELQKQRALFRQQLEQMNEPGKDDDDLLNEDLDNVDLGQDDDDDNDQENKYRKKHSQNGSQDQNQYQENEFQEYDGQSPEQFQSNKQPGQDDQDYIQQFLQKVEEQQNKDYGSSQENQQQQDDEMLNQQIKEAKQKNQDFEDKFEKVRQNDVTGDNDKQILELEMIVDEQAKIKRIQKVQIQALKHELQVMNHQARVKDSLLSQLGQKEQSIQDQTGKYTIQIQSLQEQIEQTKTQIAQIQQKTTEMDQQNKADRLNLEDLKKEFKQYDAESNKRDLKLNRLQEDLDQIKIELQQQQINVYDKSGDSKQIQQKLTTDNQQIQRQIVEILTAFKKQLKLIDILKRQKNHLIAGQIFAYSEDEFLKALDLGKQV